MMAARSGTTLAALVEEALRARLAPRPSSARDFQLTLPTVEGTPAPRVDVAERVALHDLLDDDR
jgi:hypothetical protein